MCTSAGSGASCGAGGSSSGAGSGGGTSGAGSNGPAAEALAEQLVYAPYGSVLARDVWSDDVAAGGDSSGEAGGGSGGASGGGESSGGGAGSGGVAGLVADTGAGSAGHGLPGLNAPAAGVSAPGHQGLFFIRLGTATIGSAAGWGGANDGAAGVGSAASGSASSGGGSGGASGSSGSGAGGGTGGASGSSGSGAGAGSGAGSGASSNPIIGPSGVRRARFDDPALAPDAVGFYYNRNRNLLPHLGRFQQRDLNESAAPVVALAMNAQAVEALLGAFDSAGHYGDGLSLHGYVGQNPVDRTDAAGLFFGFGDVLGSASVRTSLTALEIGSGVAAGLDMYSAILSGVGWYNLLVDSVIGAAADRLGGRLFDYALDAAQAGFAAMRRAVNRGGMNELGAEAMSRGVCLVEGTRVMLPDGSLEAVENVCRGDQVLSLHEDAPRALAGTNRVSRVFRRVASAVLWLTLASGETLGITPEHVVWEQERGWVEAGELCVGDALRSWSGEPVAVLGVERGEGPRVVYNLEVAESRTYFAQGVWVHNNPCARVFRPRNMWHKGVWFDEFGFPDFTPHAKYDVRITPTGSRASDFAAANQQVNLPEGTPENWTWHHHQETGRMQLVPLDLHRSIGHDGGWMIWGHQSGG